jgi:hypothetical protein
MTVVGEIIAALAARPVVIRHPIGGHRWLVHVYEFADGSGASCSSKMATSPRSTRATRYTWSKGRARCSSPDVAGGFPLIRNTAAGAGRSPLRWPAGGTIQRSDSPRSATDTSSSSAACSPRPRASGCARTPPVAWGSRWRLELPALAPHRAASGRWAIGTGDRLRRGPSPVRELLDKRIFRNTCH